MPLRCAAVLPLLLFFSCNGPHEAVSPRSPDTSEHHADSVMAALKNFFEPLGRPKPGEWRHSFHEKHQSFADYVECSPVRPDEKRKKIYIQPIGEFDTLREGIIHTAAEYLHAFFNLEVEVNLSLSSSIIPDQAGRMNEGQRQVLTHYILDKVLEPTLPDDAAAYIAFTTFDLYPEESWNFVFGQASVKKRIGVWSLARFGDPAAGKNDYLVCLIRTLRTASHETCHMFSMAHCVKYRCNMNGSNSLEESNRKPLWLCPECVCKLCYGMGISEEKHLRSMKAFWEKQQQANMVEVYEKMIAALKK